MPAAKLPQDNGPDGLCLQCGLCCNGVIFADVRLQPGDNAERLEALGLPITGGNRGFGPPKTASQIKNYKFPQPCAVLDGCCCRIYPNRPVHCRQFECLLLQNVKANQIPSAAALEIIHRARTRVEQVLDLLHALGDTDEALPLAARFHQTGERLETLGLDAEAGHLYGQLTLAFHDLNLLICESFYH